MKKAFFAAAVLGVLLSNDTARAVDKWWDINGTTADSGQAAATGTWSTGVANWNTDSTGGAGGAFSAWTSGTADRAFFSAGGDAIGSFTINLPAALTTGALTIEEGTVLKTGSALSVQNITVNNNAAFFTNAALGLTVAAGGSLTLNGPNATIGNSNPGSGGSFLGSSSANTNMPITLNGGGRVSANGGAGIVTIYTGLIGGTGPLQIDGNGVFRLTTTTATYSGATIINGTLQMSTTANVLPSGTALTINAGGKYDLQTSQTVASLDGAGNLAATSSNQLTIAGTASTVYSGVWSGGRINVNKSGGTGTLTLMGVNTSSGRFTLTNGNVIVDAAASLGGNVMDLHVDGGTLTLNQAAESVENLVGTGGSIVLNNAALSLVVDPVATVTSSSVISGAGGITKVNVISGATVRTQVLAGNNTYDGNTLVQGGILSVQHNNALGSTNGYTEVNQVGAVAAELLFTTAAGSVTTFEPLRISGGGASNNGVIAVTGGATPTISGPVTLIGDSTITVSGTSSVLYNNANSFTSLANQNLTLQGGAGTSPLGVGTISGAIALGSGSLTKLQGGTWVLSGSNSYTGATNINAGVLSVSNVGNTGANSNLGQNGTINLGGATTTTGTLRYTGIGETSDKVVNLAGTTGGGTIDQSGAGVLRFTSNLTATGSGAKTLTLTGSTAGTGELAGTIAENGGATAVTKAGTGTWSLTAANTYTGVTTINNGTLAANNTTGSATGTGAVTINNGGTLAGSGAVAGDVTVNNGGNVAPGNSIDTLNLGANLSFIAGGSFVAEIDSSAAFSVAADLLNIGGNLSIATGALLSLSDIAGTSQVLADGTKFTLMSYAGTWDGGTFDLAPDGGPVLAGVNSFLIDYNDTTPGLNFPSDTPLGVGISYLTITVSAVPEPTAFLFGGLACGLIGLVHYGRKYLTRRTVA